MNSSVFPFSSLRSVRFATPFLALLLVGLQACSESSPTSQNTTGTTQSDQPAAATFVNGRPQGLYFMTRFWSGTGSLEKSAWYFAPNGDVYRDLRYGFSAADLAAHDGMKGTATISGDKLKITYTDGTVTESAVEIDGTAFMFDGGIFTPVGPFTNASQVVGTHEGGESLSHPGGSAIISRTLELKADGSFRFGGVSFVQAGDKPNEFTGGGSSETTGQWKLSGYSLTLTDANGVAVRGIIFPYDDSTTPINPDWFFFGGMMFKRR